MGLTAFLCLITTRHPDAIGLVTQPSPWDVSHLLLGVHINAYKKTLVLVGAQYGAVGLKTKWDTL